MKKRESDPRAAFQTALQHFQKNQFLQARNRLIALREAFPAEPGVLRLLGAACSELGRHEEALGHFASVVELEPSAPDYFNLGKALQLAWRLDEALRAYNAGLMLSPRDARLLQGRASSLSQLGRADEAIAGFIEVLNIDPNLVEARVNLGRTLMSAGRAAEAAPHLEHAIRLNANDAAALGALVRAKLVMGDWNGLDEAIATLVRLTEAGGKSDPMPLLTISDLPELHRSAAKIRADALSAGLGLSPMPPVKASAAEKIRVAYVSADFRNHPTSRLIAGLLEAHDRTRFEIIAVSIGADDRSEMRQRIVAGCDVFVEASALSEMEIAARVRQLGADIAVDLMGYTRDARTKAFQVRLAPVQVNYLGYPGTMAVGEIDYIVIDRSIATPRVCRNLTEKPVILPDCYQPNDRNRSRPHDPLPRREYGLPDSGFVFCCFNNTGKITPQMFRIWMRILAAVDGGVLWLFASDEAAMRNLRAEAVRQNIAGERLVRAERLDNERHLARYLHADLVLDTCPYGAHTTGSDALWMGRPLLTLEGQSFASRVAGSLLRTVGLPELIAGSAEDYERMAITLAHEPHTLAAYRRHLDEHRLVTPLFDTARYARNLELAYVEMYRRRQRGENPKAIDVSVLALRKH